MAAIVAILAGLSVSQWVALIRLLPIVIQLFERMAKVVEPAMRRDVKALLDLAHKSHTAYQAHLESGATHEQAAQRVRGIIPLWEQQWMDRASGGPSAQ